MTRSCDRLFRLTCLLALLLFALPVVAKVPGGTWLYRTQPGDNIWTLAQAYLKPSVPWQKLQQLNHVTDPYHLAPGTRLRFPVAWLRVQPAKATVVAVSGDAVARLPGQATPVPVTAGMQLGDGAKVYTKAHASLTLQFADGSRLLMHPNAEVSLDRMSAYGSTGMANTDLRLQHGRIDNVVTHMPGTAAHFIVHTPTVVSSVRGTSFRAAFNSVLDHSLIEVLSDRVAVTSGHRTTDVRRGAGIVVSQKAGLGRVHRLLAAPALACPAQPVRGLAQTLTWPALAGAVRYRVQIAPTVQFETLLFDHMTGATPQVTLPDLPNGSYALRIHGVASDGLEGLDAACTLRFAAHPQPPLVRQPQPDSKVRRSHPEFLWTQNQSATSYSWQLATSDTFTHLLAERSAIHGQGLRSPVQLPLGRYYWRVASRNRAGELGPYTPALPFDRVAPPPTPVASVTHPSKHELTFSWPSAGSDLRYRIQVAHHADFAHPIIDRTLTQPTLQIRRPGSGTWYIRVQDIGSDGYASAWGPVQKIHLKCTACRILVGAGALALLKILLLL